MSSPQQAIKARQELRRTITRADKLAARCLGQVCDGDLPMVDRETAEKRLQLACLTANGLDQQLSRINEALDGS